MLKALGVAAVIALAGTTAAPAQAVAPVTLAPVAVVTTVAVEAPTDAVVTFESPEVGTVAAPVEATPEPVQPVTEVVEPVAPFVPAPELTQEPVTLLPTPVVENTSTTPVVTGGTVETTPEVPEVPEAPPVVPEVPAVPVVEETVSTPETETNVEFFEAEAMTPEGGTYVGSYTGTEDIWTGAGKVAVKGTMTKTVDGNPNNMDPSNVLFVWHVYTV